MTLNVDDVLAPMKETRRKGDNLTLEWRLRQLDAMQLMITEKREDFVHALHKDLGKERTESIYSEILLVELEIKRFKKELRQWMKPKRVSYPGAIFPCVCEIQSVPLSDPCLIISPFNYPVGISLLPAVGSLGGGNPCVLKPSELCPTVSKVFAKMVPLYFDKGAFQVVEGGVEETTALLQHHYGLIHFTGSERVGRIVQSAAAKTLSPTVLELGGKTPTIITEDCPDDMNVVCHRLLGGKLLNAGQTCVAPDFIFCHGSKIDSFCKAAISTIEELFELKEGEKNKTSEFPSIVTENHAERLENMIKEAESKGGEIIYGGSKLCNKSCRYIPPTIVLNPDKDDSAMMKEEIFGPLIPVIPFDTDDEAIINIHKILPGIPLALYVFSKSKERYEYFMSKIPSASAMRNEAILQFVIPDFPFGGLGLSGLGSYQGKQSFDTFTHERTSLYHPCHALFEYGNLR